MTRASHDLDETSARGTVVVLCRDCCEVGVPEQNDRGERGGGPNCSVCGSTRLVEHDEISTLEIAHVDCDAFYASVEKRDRPEIRSKPLIVGHASGRGVVTTACYMARRWGVKSAMPMYQAVELCPDAVIIPPDLAKYRRVSQDIRSILLAATPVIEPLSLDEAYLDLGEAVRHEGPTAASALAHIALRVEREVGITVSIGLAPNKFLAKIASDLEKPRGYAVIGRAEAAMKLAHMRVRKIHGVGPATAERMEALGLTTIADLQRMSEGELVALFGSFGRQLARYAVGDDQREVRTAREAKSVSVEDTFVHDTRSVQVLLAAVEPMAVKVANVLQRKRLAGRTVVVKLKTADFQLRTRQVRLAYPTQRAASIFSAARVVIEREADGRLFRLVGVGVADLEPQEAADPPGLFDR
mgnify:CR=1 FL=1